ncbi:asparagine synthase (glutamine-hydrolyzing) [Candidatus Amesbacteria bacterium RIFCSPHIGHO2_02_FULL_47_9]|uniref:asparagine synthase (glutamine-hydrolyzing) n=1 Tax=Candidatus Amesbacteria bacterium RIFCSPHIGHO2_01_FULL_48_32b TaxID=1797253 RepID=A0A1F4YDV1_9BACT|nr:MAG: asparagine synthase (glutamine-hydrolyzing) [Candidatus Amesbacteria bacterium RIFCSPHIGHO2_01_FULL_48_32b]OGD04517.1 MAG: asparagine synthase (glutamine-hydrolyzing) [Candidatus Amesbacteria bacterium RIFCSPHIGHO2_02_FULL_47_9]OGD08113.1 MAG: asparagine synthase (glutamine-hydrolyzing) [Candidatus Amesbacteria bacterium RIFCSPLOWO2_01_FULL_49_25]
MCGIAGIVDFSSPVISSQIGKIAKTIVHRGPDSGGSFVKNHVGLGIRRLKIIDLKTGDQPISNEDGSLTVVFNGEIYNYKLIREQLIKNGHKLKTTSDTETLVHLYEDSGKDFLQKLNGMFTFALWDEKKQSLLLARDHAGIKPLFYHHKGSKLIFGSEIKTILSVIQTPKIDPDSLFLYTFLGYVPTPRTIYQDIFQLPPGSTLTFSQSGLKIHQYYDLFSQPNPEPADLDSMLDTVVSRQAIADVPVGLLLSGGLDSSILAYYLTRQKHEVKSFSISFAHQDFNEGSHAAQVAKILGTRHFDQPYSASDLLTDFPVIQKLMDQPFADPSLFPTYHVCRLASSHVKVALSGDGGDEVFAGYPTYLGHRFANLLPWFPSSFKSLLVNLAQNIPAVKFPLFSSSYKFGDTLANFFSGLGLPVLHRQLQWMVFFTTGQIAPEALFKTSPIKELFSLPYPQDQVKTAQLLDFQTYLRDAMLLKSDRASMFNGLEVRVPYLDREIISFAFSQTSPFTSLFSTKLPLRNLLKGKLPENIRNRPKKGFGLPLSDWISGPLKTIVSDYVYRRDISDAFPRVFVDAAWSQNHLRTLWMVFAFSVWQEQWAKGRI